jgi:hypothetical protein
MLSWETKKKIFFLTWTLTHHDQPSWLLIGGCWLLIDGCWLLIDGCWLLIGGYWLLAVVAIGCWLLAVGC